MPFETPFNPANFAGSITASVHEHNAPPGAPPTNIIRADQAWSVHVRWENTGMCTGMITGNWNLHVLLETIGPGNDLILTDPLDHVIPLTPGVAPVVYDRHFDVSAATVPDPGPDGRLYKLVVSLTYFEPTGSPGPMAAFVEGPIIQFYRP